MISEASTLRQTYPINVIGSCSHMKRIVAVTLTLALPTNLYSRGSCDDSVAGVAVHNMAPVPQFIFPPLVA